MAVTMPVEIPAKALAPDAVDAFHRDGYLVSRGFFDAAATRQVTRWVEDITAMPEAPGRTMVYYEDSVTEPALRVLSRIEYFAGFHRDMERLLTGSAFSDAVAALFGEPAQLFKEKINFKMPGGQGFEPHQDMQAGWQDFGSLHITALVSVDPATRENGCLEVAAGQHKRGLIGSLWRPLQGAELDGIDFTPVETEPGDVVFFDSFTPHRSAPNLTDRKRRILYVTYGKAAEGDMRERYFAEKRKNFPPDIEREPGKTYAYKV